MAEASTSKKKNEPLAQDAGNGQDCKYEIGYWNGHLSMPFQTAFITQVEI